jgi:hypothetical protein
MSRLITVSRLVAMLLLAAATLGFAATAASAAPAPTNIDPDLTALWTTILETPSAQNAFGTGGAAFACWNIGDGTVAPFGPSAPSCTVNPGTKIFVAAFSAECSTFEERKLTTEAQLRACAEQMNVQTAPSVTVDDQSVPVTEVETPLMNIVLPAGNLFGLKAGTLGSSVGAGWVAHLNPLSAGTHTIAGSGELPSGKSFSFTTKIIVKPS